MKYDVEFCTIAASDPVHTWFLATIYDISHIGLANIVVLLTTILTTAFHLNHSSTIIGGQKAFYQRTDYLMNIHGTPSKSAST